MILNWSIASNTCTTFEECKTICNYQCMNYQFSSVWLIGISILALAIAKYYLASGKVKSAKIFMWISLICSASFVMIWANEWH